MARLSQGQMEEVVEATRMLRDREANHTCVTSFTLEDNGGKLLGSIVYDDDQEEFVWSQMGD